MKNLSNLENDSSNNDSINLDEENLATDGLLKSNMAALYQLVENDDTRVSLFSINYPLHTFPLQMLIQSHKEQEIMHPSLAIPHNSFTSIYTYIRKLLCSIENLDPRLKSLYNPTELENLTNNNDTKYENINSYRQYLINDLHERSLLGETINDGIYSNKFPILSKIIHIG